MRHVLRYISKSKSLGICYGGDTSIEPFGFSDTDCGGDVSSRKSTGGH